MTTDYYDSWAPLKRTFTASKQVTIPKEKYASLKEATAYCPRCLDHLPLRCFVVKKKRHSICNDCRILPRPRTPKQEKVAELHAKGLKVRDIAKILDISTQRVYQLLERIDAERSEEAAS